MMETTKEKLMHISSSSASVREFAASKLVVYWKSMSHERLIYVTTLSHQFTMETRKNLHCARKSGGREFIIYYCKQQKKKCCLENARIPR